MSLGTGYNLTQWLAASNVPMGSGAGSQLGEVVMTPRRAFVRVQLNAASAPVDRGSLVGFTASGDAYALTTTVAATVGRLARVGVALGAGNPGEVGWVQVYGPAPLAFAAAAVARAALYTTATAGKVDDAATTGVLAGIVAPVASGAVTVENAELNWPYLASVA